MKIKKVVLIIVGVIALGLGSVGIVLPILPTVPFYLLAVFCFANSSKRLHNWFINTNVYKNNLESYVKHKGMTKITKIKIIMSVTLLMGFGFYMMAKKGIWIPCVILASVWIFHLGYFMFGVKTIKE